MEIPVKAPLLLLLLPIVAALAFTPNQTALQDPQSPANREQLVSTIISLSELQIEDMKGSVLRIPARRVVEVRMFDDMADHVRVEILYENGDYSMIAGQAIHILRSGDGTRDVKLIRTKLRSMRFPRLP